MTKTLFTDEGNHRAGWWLSVDVSQQLLSYLYILSRTALNKTQFTSLTWKHWQPLRQARQSAAHSLSASSCCCIPSPAAQGSTQTPVQVSLWKCSLLKNVALQNCGWNTHLTCGWLSEEKTFKVKTMFINYLLNVFLRQWHPSSDLNK